MFDIINLSRIVTLNINPPWNPVFLFVSEKFSKQQGFFIDKCLEGLSFPDFHSWNINQCLKVIVELCGELF